MAGWMHEIKSMSWQGPFSFLGAFFGNQRTRSLLKLSTAERVMNEERKKQVLFAHSFLSASRNMQMQDDGVNINIAGTLGLSGMG